MIQKAISKRVKDLDITLGELCCTVGQYPQNISSFLRGSRQLSLAKVTEIMTALGLSVGPADTTVGDYPASELRHSLREQMNELSVTQKTIAKECRISEPSLSLFLNGKCMISVNSLERIMKRLNLGVVCHGRPQIHK
ncbi:MAG: helix-turn-helix domain-containing protein [Muribaculum sp.]|nr:helix-turn-helix domain-containing protein [Muribaculum sp.]